MGGPRPPGGSGAHRGLGGAAQAAGRADGAQKMPGSREAAGHPSHRLKRWDACRGSRRSYDDRDAYDPSSTWCSPRWSV
ncbi:hypothetical protein HMPREF9005_0682 [Actinomyces sp. oral taxon 178 str. F0338]|nr:hypothetical protein HMPREF9005_0682 [Actinomyces sp. oral taxon 178 str. F0338]